MWYARLGSNQRLSAPEADALSTELRARIKAEVSVQKTEQMLVFPYADFPFKMLCFIFADVRILQVRNPVQL